MSAAEPAPRPPPPPPGQRSGSVAALQERLGGLLVEREKLRHDEATAFRLERNRRELARVHRELARALGLLRARA
jgi:hypothetical protein